MNISSFIYVTYLMFKDLFFTHKKYQNNFFKSLLQNCETISATNLSLKSTHINYNCIKYSRIIPNIYTKSYEQRQMQTNIKSKTV